MLLFVVPFPPFFTNRSLGSDAQIVSYALSKISESSKVLGVMICVSEFGLSIVRS